MADFSPDDFEEILEAVKNHTKDLVIFDEIRSIESNFNTKAIKFKAVNNYGREGTIVIGEDKSLIAVDINLEDGEIISFIIADKGDDEGIRNIMEWFEQNYRK